MNSYRDLVVWQKSMEMVRLIYQLTNTFPKEELYSLTSQVRRSAVSIPSNIAEGYGRQHRLEYIRFLQIARGSLFELQTQMELAIMIGYLKREELITVDLLSVEIEKMLNSLIGKLTASKSNS